MNRKKIIGVTLLSIIIMGILAFQWFIQNEFKKYPKVLEMVFNNEDLYYQGILDQKEYLKEKYKISYAKELKASYKGDSFSVIGIDENYLELMPLDIIAGNEPDQGQPQIIINNRFAEKHFIGGESLGKSIELFGKVYEVVGVYKNSNLENIAGIDKEIIYVPYKELSKTRGNTLNKVIFSQKNGEKILFFREKLLEYISSKIPYIELDKLNIHDYVDSARIISQFFKELVFTFEILVFVFITVTLVRKIKSYNKTYKEELQNNYAYEIISKNLTDILFEMIIMVLLIFLWIFLAQGIINFKFEIPGRILPPDDIFDFSFYFNLYSNFKSSNNISCFGRLYRGLLKISSINFTVSTIFLVTLFGIALDSNMKRKSIKPAKGGEFYGKTDV